MSNDQPIACQFCGRGEVIFSQTLDQHGPNWYATCSRDICVFIGYFSTEAEAVAAWNTRAHPAASADVGELCERLRMLRVILKSGDYDGADLMTAWLSMIDAADTITAQAALIERLTGALEWYGEQARLCRLIHSEGETGRQELSADGGNRARTALRSEAP